MQVENDLSLGSIVRFLRLKKNISARSLSKTIGASESYISKVENDSVMPTVDNFARIVTALQCSSEEVYTILLFISGKEPDD